MKEQVKKLIEEINRIHKEFSESCFDQGMFEQVKLSRTISNVPASHIYKYRLVLHESINDYLMTSHIELKYFYRVKTRESIDDKITRYSERDNQYPVNSWLNDIFGARIILTKSEIAEVMEELDNWQDELGLKNWYLRDKEGYKGLHIYFKNRSNFYFPWELQIWDKEDLMSNVENHEKFKRSFI
ncbi:GTP pyrophosphokinase [Vibrio splendidus]|uniref:GTP pyrophosphokinase n=1 Tax=Vibrio splendidus TaxID=29497 RepID=UPI000D3C7DE8|nr:GTP pyrophosphokinase [Vibrio splendidus]PTP73948.1 GTP pyrophosphokinase [Vibrio splendidus]